MQGRALLLVVLLLPACKREQAEPPEEIWVVERPPAEYTGGGAEELPPLPKYPDPPVIAGGCERFTAPAPDDPRALIVRFAHILRRYGEKRPRVVHGHPLALALDCRADVDSAVPVSFCLQRPDGTVLREQADYRNADIRCVGCDPYPGAPANVCANACQAERFTPELTPFDGVAMEQDGAYVLSVQFADGSCTPASVIFDAVGSQYAG